MGKEANTSEITMQTEVKEGCQCPKSESSGEHVQAETIVRPVLPQEDPQARPPPATELYCVSMQVLSFSRSLNLFECSFFL